MSEEPIDVTPRRKPVQARSRERVDSILKSARAVFHELGVDGTSMSEIARRSGMSLASLYRYFPNKASIVKVIAEGYVTQMEQAFRERLAESSASNAVEILVDLYFDIYRSEPAYSAIWSSVNSMPELRELDLRELYTNAADVDARLKELAPGLSDERRWSASLLLPRAIGSLLGLAVTLPEPEAQNLVLEVKAMARAYMSALTGDDNA